MVLFHQAQDQIAPIVCGIGCAIPGGAKVEEQRSTRCARSFFFVVQKLRDQIALDDLRDWLRHPWGRQGRRAKKRPDYVGPPFCFFW